MCIILASTLMIFKEDTWATELYAKPPRPQRLNSAIFCKNQGGARLSKICWKFFTKWLIWEKKGDASKIYVVLFMLHFKREHCLESAILVDFEQKNGPKSRSSVGGFPYNFREIIIEIIKKNWRWPWKLMFCIKINIKSRRKRASICSFRLQINENQEGNEHVFKIMFKNFKIFDGCYSENFEFLGRAEGVFYPKVKKESKN